jgi:hypothetical protein
LITDKSLYINTTLIAAAAALPFRFPASKIFSAGVISYFAYDSFKQIQAHIILAKSQTDAVFQETCGKRVALVIQSDFDKNGAFKVLENQVYVIRKLLEGNYTPIYRNVTTLKEIEDSLIQLTERKNIIDILWLRAHGTRTCLNIGKDIDLDSRSLETIKPALNRMSPDGIVILDSCKTAAFRGAEGFTIAYKIAQSLPGRILYAASDETRPESIKVISTYPFKIRFTAFHYDQGVFPYDGTKVYKF